MKFIFIILLLFFSNSVFANEDNNGEVEVINLHESKSLDQMVLENLNDAEESEEIDKNLNESDEIENNTVEVKQIEFVNDNFVRNNETKIIKNYFANLKKINSKTSKRNN